ncbi:MAG: hypothetical protein ACI9FU_001388 [Granulosicoccus sp.]|jgi:hypothetical protein
MTAEQNKHMFESTILVLINFSEGEDNSLLYAISYAKNSNCSLILYHTTPEPLDQDAEKEQHWKQRANEKMSEFTNHYSKELSESNIPYQTYVNAYGVKKGVKTLAAQQFIELVITDSPRESGIFWKSLDKFSSAILTLDSHAILVIPANVKWKKPERVLLALDGDEYYIKAQFESFRILNSTFSSKVNVLEVIDVTGFRKWDQFELKKWLPNLSLKRDVVYGVDIVHSIIQYAEKVPVDLISVVSFPDHPLGCLRGTSVTKKIVPQINIPLLILK